MVTATGPYTTAAGSKCTIYEQANGADTVQFIVKDSAKDKPNKHATGYMHGSGGLFDQALTQAALKVQVDGILENDGVLMQCGGSKTSVYRGQNHWWRTDARVAYSEGAQIAEAATSIGDWAWIGRSMGDNAARYIATRDPYLAPRTIGYISMSGIYSALDEFDDGNHFGLPGWYGTQDPPAPPARPGSNVTYSDPAWAAWRSALAAWKSDPATVAARAALAAATVDFDEARQPDSIWVGKQVLVLYGTADTIAWPSLTSLKFWNDRHAVFGAKSKLVAVPGGTHSPPGTYDAPAVMEFLKDLWGIAAPEITLGSIVRRGYVIDDDGLLIPLVVPPFRI